MSLARTSELSKDAVFIELSNVAARNWAIAQLTAWRTGVDALSQPIDRTSALTRIKAGMSFHLLERRLSYDIPSLIASHPSIAATVGSVDEALITAVTNGYADALCESLEKANDLRFAVNAS